ncbi:hypothetical protein KCU62_g3584, partial [Aureobasidium sp. EXF-3399]
MKDVTARSVSNRAQSHPVPPETTRHKPQVPLPCPVIHQAAQAQHVVINDPFRDDHRFFTPVDRIEPLSSRSAGEKRKLSDVEPEQDYASAKRHSTTSMVPYEEEDEADAADADYEDRIVKITGIPLREEIFEILEETIDDLTGHGQDDELERIKTSLLP